MLQDLSWNPINHLSPVHGVTLSLLVSSIRCYSPLLCQPGPDWRAAWRQLVKIEQLALASIFNSKYPDPESRRVRSFSATVQYSSQAWGLLTQLNPYPRGHLRLSWVIECGLHLSSMWAWSSFQVWQCRLRTVLLIDDYPRLHALSLSTWTGINVVDSSLEGCFFFESYLQEPQLPVTSTKICNSYYLLFSHG